MHRANNSRKPSRSNKRAEKTVMIGGRVPVPQARHFLATARANDTTMAQLVRKWVREYIEAGRRSAA